MEFTHAFFARRTPEPGFQGHPARTCVKPGAGYRSGLAPGAHLRMAPAQPRGRPRIATLLMTDIVGSTSLIARLGDVRWADLLEQHNRQARAGVELFGGRIVDFAGDRVFAVFHSAESAVASATAMHALMRALRLNVRAGVHAGEVEVREEQVIGLAVHIAARIAACARQGETLVSQPVRDRLDGSDVHLSERGVYRLKGVPDRWPLFSVGSQGMPHAVARDGFDRRAARAAASATPAP